MDGLMAEAPDHSSTRWHSHRNCGSPKTSKGNGDPRTATLAVEQSWQPDLGSRLVLATVAKPARPSRLAHIGASASSLNAGPLSQMQRTAHERSEHLDGLRAKAAESADDAADFMKMAKALSKQ
jgi:hypothetical protein